MPPNNSYNTTTDSNVKIHEKGQGPRTSLLVLLLLSVCIAAVFYFKDAFFQVSQQPVFTEEKKIAQDEFAGSIYLSLAPQGKNFVNIYRFSLHDRVLQPYLTGSNVVHYTPSFGMKGSVLFASNLSTNTAEVNPVPFHVYHRDIRSGVQKKITSLQDVLYRRQPQYSDFLKGVFYAGKVTVSDLQKDSSIDGWNIYFVDENGNDSLFASGAHPKLSPDGKFLVAVKSDGLYVTDLATRETTRVWEARAGIDMQIDISRDGKRLVWNNPNKSEVHLFSIDSWSPFVMRQEKVVEIGGSWPVFSPTGKNLAFEEVDSPKTPTNPRLVVVNLETLEKKVLVDLKEFDPLRLFVDSWTY